MRVPPFRLPKLDWIALRIIEPSESSIWIMLTIDLGG